MNVGSVNLACNTQACKKQTPNFGAVQMSLSDARQLLRPGEKMIPGDLLYYMYEQLFQKGRIIASEYTALRDELGERVVVLNIKNIKAIVETKNHEVADKIRAIVKDANEFSISKWLKSLSVKREQELTEKQRGDVIDMAKRDRLTLFRQIEDGTIKLQKEPILTPVAEKASGKVSGKVSGKGTLIIESYGMGPLPNEADKGATNFEA